MNRRYFPAAAILMLAALPLAHGAAKPAEDARTKLKEIDAMSANVSDEAFHLNAMAQSQMDPRSHLERLDAVKEEVNQIGRELQSLEAERDSLAPWQVQALAETTELMHQVADHAEKAIQTFQTDRQHLWATPYVAETEAISGEAARVSTLLHNALKLADVRERELRLEQTLSAE
jgi:predicted transcriptional regulator